MNNTYGTKRPALITSEDVDIFYSYRPSRSEESVDFSHFKRLDSSCLYETEAEYVDGDNSSVMTLPGMYDLRLPMDKFNMVGVYTVYIKPKERITTLVDANCTLAAYPTIRGFVVRAEEPLNASMMSNGGMVGYRVEYLDNNGKRTGEYRIITSSNLCEPTVQNFNDSSQKGIRYILNNSTSNLIFCTVSPSSALSFKANSFPNIGTTGQRVAIVSTSFNPIMLEIEVVEHDIETISTMLEGEQIRDLNHGIITTFDKNGNIYHQAHYGTANDDEGIHHDFKINGMNDFSQASKLTDIKNAIK